MTRIERRHWVLVRNLTLLSIVIAVAPTGLRKLRSYLAQDAFADITRPPSNDPLGIRLEGVRFRHYSGNRLLTFAAADRIDVSRDRFHMTMTGVHDGLYRDGDRAFRYQARNATWDARRRILDVLDGVQIQNEKLNLRARGAQFDSRKKRLTAQGDVKGTLMKGRFFAQNLMFDTRTEGFRVGPVSWTGKLPEKLLQDDVPEQVTQTVWKFKAKLSSSPGGKDKVVTHTEAVATDGEVIVVAPKIVHNQKTDEIVATGTDTARVQYFSVKANLIASRVEVFRKEKRAVLTGNVIMLVKAKKDQVGKVKMEALPAFQPLLPDQVKADPPKVCPKEETKKDEGLRDSKNIRDYPLTMAAAKIEYWYGKGSRRAVITGDPQGRQEMNEGRWRHLWSNVGFYDGEKEELKLVSTKGRKDTRMKNSVGDDAVADWMVISTKEDDEAFSGAGIEGDFADLSGEDDPRNEKKKAETPPAKTPPPGGGGTTGGGNPPPVKDRFRRA